MSKLTNSNPRLRAAACSAVVVLIFGGCATGLGPKAVRSERPTYNQQIARSGDEQMLLNLVRIRYNETPLFLELGSVVASYGFEAGASAGGTVSRTTGNNQASVGAALTYSEHPTVTYSPLTGDQFAERMLSPIPLDAMMLFAQSGWSTERLFLVTVLRINNVFNSPTSTGPTPERAPEFNQFATLAAQLQSLAQASLLGSNWERHGHETNAPGRNPLFWIRMPADTNSPFASEVQAVRRALELAENENEFQLNAFPFKRKPTEVGIRCRSLLGILYFLSTAVEPPQPHVDAGLLTITREANGQPFDWSKFTGKVMAIHSRKDRPPEAAVAVPYRGWWFYIADNDQNSKTTFNLLNILFQLQATTGSGKSPVLTLSVGS